MGFWWIVAHQANHVTFIQLAPECPVCVIIMQTNEGVDVQDMLPCLWDSNMAV